MKSPRVLSFLAEWFLYLFCLDAVLSTASEILHAAHVAAAPLDLFRNLVAFIVVAWSSVIFSLLCLTPRLRKRLLLPPVLFALWAAYTGCFPLPLLGLPGLPLLLSLLQLAISAAVLVPHLRGAPLFFAERPSFSWLNLASSSLLTAGIVAFWLTAMGGYLARTIEDSTAGFLHIRPSGVYLEERTFKKAGKEVRLIAMMHIARDDFYESLSGSLHDSGPAVVLLEGISDEQGLFKKNFSYANLAQALSIDAQEDSSFTRDAREALSKDDGKSGSLIYRNADIDISSFQPRTIAFLNALADLMNSQSLQEALDKLQTRDSPLLNESDTRVVFSDILDMRNRHILRSITDALATNDVIIVPWGAMHMPFLSSQLESLGFEETGRKAYRAIGFGS